MLDIKKISLHNIVFFSIITVITLALTAFITLPVQADTATITGNGVNMRSGPGTNYQIIDTIPKGTVAEVLSQQDGWVKIYSARISGWVSASYAEIKVTPKVTVTGETVNLRSGPGTSYSKIGEAVRGDQLTLIEQQGDWYVVKNAAGTICYMSAAYAQTSNQSAATPGRQETAAPTNTGSWKIQILNGPINIRSGPGPNFDKVGMVEDQAVYSVTSKQDDWFQISLPGNKTAWVAGWLVKEIKTTENTATTPVSTSGTSPKVYLDNQLLSFEVPAIIENGRTLVPLRAIFEAMGAQVDWNDSTRTVVATKPGTRVILALGSIAPTVNGKTWNLDVPAIIKNNRTLAPLRFVGEAFGGKVSWDDASKTVHITSPEDKGRPTTAIITDERTNLRSGPGATNKAIDQVGVGEKLAIIDEKDGWYQVSRGSTNGWVAGWVIDVAWEKNEPAVNAPETSEEDEPVVEVFNPATPGEDAVWISCDKSSSGYNIAITSGAKIQAEIREMSSQITYTIKDRIIEGKYLFKETMAGSELTVKATQEGENVNVQITFPVGSKYFTSTSEGGKKETLYIPNQIMAVDRKSFTGGGERIVVTTALPATHSVFQKGDLLEITLRGISMGKAKKEYTYTDSELINSVSFEPISGDIESTLVTLDTNEMGKYSLGMGGDGTQFNIMLVDKSAVKERRYNLVVLDPGHGGKDTGARGTKIDERDVNLEIALKVGDILTSQGVVVEYTRKTDITVGLEERAQIANVLNAGVFVSIHNNANTDRSKHGTETYYYAPADTPNLFMQKEDRERLAKCIQTQMINRLGRVDRGVKHGNYSVLRNTEMPSALAEICFISNPDEQALLMQTQYKDQAAQAIAGGILQYLGK
ncbi:MAG: N-acetylmuramoyl-L-alanine amidase [Syntrophomonadaceae bacterium]|jgi:N-acetylmuramoyl-L-alanine amidase